MNINLKVEKADIRNINQNNSIFKNINYVFHFAGNGDIVPSIEKPKQYMSNQWEILDSISQILKDSLLWRRKMEFP